MLDIIVSQWDENKSKLEKQFKKEAPSSYMSIVKSIFDHVIEGFDSESITKIDNGDYQGTLIFVIPSRSYQPSVNEYLITYVYYGSCSCCDTFEGIRDLSFDADNDILSDEQIKDYMTLALHIIQKMKWLYGNE